MNEKEILKMMDHINDDYLMEASATAKRKINLKKKMLTFGIAAALAASLSVGAVAAYKAFNKESVGTYYDSSAVDKIEDSGYVSGQMTENSHFRFTLESVMKDDYSVLAVVTVKALDSTGEQFLAEHDGIHVKTAYADTGKDIEGASDLSYTNRYEKGKDTPMRLTVPVHSSDNDLDLSKAIKLTFDKYYEDNPSTFYPGDLFSGLSLELNNIKASDNVKFTASNGDVLNISEFSIAVEQKLTPKQVSDFENGGLDENEMKAFEEKYKNMKIKYKDGTTETFGDKLNSAGIYLAKNDRQIQLFDLSTLIDTDKIDSIEYLGTTYKR